MRLDFVGGVRLQSVIANVNRYDGWSMNVGRLIRDARKNRGLTQLELAERVFGTRSQGLISDYERGVKQPTPDMLERIAEALGCELVIEFREAG